MIIIIDGGSLARKMNTKQSDEKQMLLETMDAWNCSHPEGKTLRLVRLVRSTLSCPTSSAVFLPRWARVLTTLMHNVVGGGGWAVGSQRSESDSNRTHQLNDLRTANAAWPKGPW